MADGSRSFFCLPSSWAGRHISMRLRTQQPIPLIPQDPGLDNPRQMACRRASSAGPEPLSTRLQRASPGPRLQLPETSRVSPCAGGGPTAGPGVPGGGQTRGWWGTGLAGAPEPRGLRVGCARRARPGTERLPLPWHERALRSFSASAFLSPSITEDLRGLVCFPVLFFINATAETIGREPNCEIFKQLPE